MSIPIKLGFATIGLSIASVVGMGTHDLLIAFTTKDRTKGRKKNTSVSEGRGGSKKRRRDENSN